MGDGRLLPVGSEVGAVGGRVWAWRQTGASTVARMEARRRYELERQVIWMESTLGWDVLGGRRVASRNKNTLRLDAGGWRSYPVR